MSRKAARRQRRSFPRRSRPDPPEPLPAQYLAPVSTLRFPHVWNRLVIHAMKTHRDWQGAVIEALTAEKRWEIPEIVRGMALWDAAVGFAPCEVSSPALRELVITRAAWMPLDQFGQFADPAALFADGSTKAAGQ